MQLQSENRDLELDWTSCAACGRADMKLLFSKKYFGAVLRGIGQFEYSVVKCTRCGLVFVNPRVSIDNLRMMYALYPDLRTVVDVFPQARLLFGLSRRKYLDMYLEPTLQYFPRDAKILDVLCRDGSFLAEIKRLHPQFDVYGFEFRPPFLEQSSANGVSVFSGSYIDTLEEAHYPDEFFDVIYVRHVLEHFYHPGRALTEIHRILKDGGLIVVEVPNINSINRIVFGRHWIVFTSPRQLYHFSPCTLSTVLKRTGFVVSRIVHPWFYYQLFDGSLVKLVSAPILRMLARRRGSAGSLLNALRLARVGSSKFVLDPFWFISTPVSFVGGLLGRADVVVAFARKEQRGP